ncbi:pre-mRNA-splicing factor CWC22 homolog [Sipha flava]|uniref:Pre-mRNA-splicing factor CWC22 homolog n=1 Tax=Sipha flava TaxID=143950 RepID=A0A8B8G4D8_9HEMI|nr:pre-mRNA-splicing factor CWC22 homolog [Sipha flava]
MELSLEKSDTRRRFKQLAPRPITRVKILKHTKLVESSAKYQQQSWEKLKKRFAFFLSIVTEENVLLIKERIYKFNIVRAKGLFCSSILEAQLFQTKNTDLYAFMVSLINLDFPNIAELLLIRCIWQLKSGYRQHVIHVYSSSAIFIAHLIYRGVADVSLGLDVLKLLFRYPTDEDLIKTAVMFYTICGEKMKKKISESSNSIHSASYVTEF